MGATAFPASAIISGVFAPARLGSGTPSASNFLRGDGSWQTIDLSTKQDTLVSGTNIKTINSTSILGSGDISISASVAPLILGTNLVTQRNGTNAQRYRLTKTYTSDVVLEGFDIDTSDASNTDLIAVRGASGGAARGIRIGAKQDGGSLVPWLSFDTSGNIETSRRLGFSFSASFEAIQIFGSNRTIGSVTSGSMFFCETGFTTSGAIGPLLVSLQSSGNRFVNTTTANIRGVSGVVQIRNSANSDFAPLAASAMTLSALPTSDPAVAGQVWRSGNDLKISTG